MSVLPELEWTTAEDRFVDYCLWEYLPAGPFEGKLRSVNLLRHSFGVEKASPLLSEACDALRADLGPFRTVWGVKHAGGRTSWELYFYDYARLQRTRSIGRVLRILEPYVSCGLTFPEDRPYFMFSVELDSAGLRAGRPIEEIDVYVGNVGSSVSSGICYGLTGDGLLLRNFYFFFDARREREAALAKLACSAHLGLGTCDVREIAWPELADCRVLVVANKRDRDGIYFSGIDVDQLLFFLRRLSYPSEAIDFIAENRSALTHMRYDVGYDYAMEPDRIRILKSSYYGFF